MQRRSFLVGGAIGAVHPLFAASELSYNGFPLGVQTFCFNDRPFDRMLEAVVATGARGIELFRGHAEPEALFRDRQRLRQWRLTVDLNHFHDLRNKIAAAGLTLLSYDISIRSDWTPEEIDRAFQMARALGSNLITSSSNVSVSPRLDDAATRHRIRVGMHNHAESKPDEMATAEDYAVALKGRSPWLGITFDTGHFAAAGFDCVPFVDRFGDRLFALHCKDRLKDFGPQVPLGAGDARLPRLLAHLRKGKLRLPICVEHTEKEGDRVVSILNDVNWLRGQLTKGT
ncbi:MAG: TIM barrel protein [Bryobacterales bacterium]|nr:TIM barrel protein [Bryobacterales bacterium]